MTLKVYYPHGGKHFLLHWWTYNERGNIILSRTEKSVRPAFTRVCEKYPGAEIRDYLEINIVGPSKLHHEQDAAFTLHDGIDNFAVEILCRLGNVLKVGKSLPPQFEACTSYEPEDEVERDDWAEKCHFSCKNCMEKIKIIGMNKTELYQKYYEAWVKLFPPRKYVDPKLVLSQAEPAKDDEELYFANAAFGHHSAGIELNKVDVSKGELPEHPELHCIYRPSYLTSALFFYRKIKELDSKELQSMLEQKKTALEKSRKSQEQARINKRKQDEKTEIEATLAFFKEMT